MPKELPEVPIFIENGLLLMGSAPFFLHYLTAFANRTRLSKPHFQGEVFISILQTTDPIWGALAQVEFREPSRIIYRSVLVAWPGGKILCPVCRGRKVLVFQNQNRACHFCEGKGYSGSILEEEPYQDAQGDAL